MVFKTRDRLIEVARQLFLLKGLENTTMLDIANASDHGRRTRYTYFKSKSEIYDAVIQRESERHISSLREIAALDITATEKMQLFLTRNFDVIKEASLKHDSLISWLTLDFSRSDKIKRAVVEKESELFDMIVREGVRTGEFDAEQCDRLRRLIPTMVQAVSRDALTSERKEGKPSDLPNEFVKFIISTIRNKQSN